MAWREYNAIINFYDDRCAERSGVRLMNHIDEGLIILKEIDATEDAQKAFCLHPLFQADAELTTEGFKYCKIALKVDAYPVMLVMEYRHWANAWLSDKVDDYGNTLGEPFPGPLPEVRDMLIADKVQNYKDFLQYHAQTHARSRALDIYFKRWLKVLNIDEHRFRELCSKL